MMKALAIGGAALAVLGASVGGGWWYGAQKVGQAVDARLAQYGEEGVQIDYGAREIGGFPLAYEVRFTDLVLTGADGALRFEASHVESVSALTGGEVETRLPETARLFIAIPDQPEMAFDVTTRGATLFSARDGRSGRYQAERIEMELAQDHDDPVFARLDSAWSGLRGDFALDAEDLASADLAADEIAYAMEMRGPKDKAGAPAAMASENLLHDVQTSLEGFPAMAPETLLEPGARARISMRIGRSEARGAQQFAPAMPAINFDTRGEATEMTVAVDDRRLTADMSSRKIEANYDLSALDLPDLLLSAPLTSMALSGPLDEMAADAPYALELLLDQVAVNDAFMDAVDQKNLLTRAPARLDLAVSGVVTLHGVAPDAPEPEFGAVKISRAALDLFGAQARLSGEVTPPASGQGGPVGRLMATLKGWTPLLDFAIARGVAPPDARLAAQAMGAQYADPEADGDAVRADVKLHEGKVFVNGQRVQ